MRKHQYPNKQKLLNIQRQSKQSDRHNSNLVLFLNLLKNLAKICNQAKMWKPAAVVASNFIVDYGNDNFFAELSRIQNYYYKWRKNNENGLVVDESPSFANESASKHVDKVQRLLITNNTCMIRIQIISLKILGHIGVECTPILHLKLIKDYGPLNNILSW